MNTKLKAAIITVIIAAVIIGAVWGITYYIAMSNQVSGNVAEQQIGITPTLTLTPTDIQEGDSWTLTATTNNPNADGKAIALFESGVLISGTETTMTWDAGQSLYTATWTFAPTVGLHSYTAGDPSL